MQTFIVTAERGNVTYELRVEAPSESTARKMVAWSFDHVGAPTVVTGCKVAS